MEEQMSPDQIQALKDFVHSFKKAFDSIFQSLLKIAKYLGDAFIKSVSSNAKWVHLCFYSKKRRVRKKYRCKLIEQYVAQGLNAT